MRGTFGVALLVGALLLPGAAVACHPAPHPADESEALFWEIENDTVSRYDDPVGLALAAAFCPFAGSGSFVHSAPGCAYGLAYDHLNRGLDLARTRLADVPEARDLALRTVTFVTEIFLGC